MAVKPRKIPMRMCVGCREMKEKKALLRIGDAPCITRDPEAILAADHIILPGVGSFGDAMEKLHRYGLVDVIREAAARRVARLGSRAWQPEAVFC